MKKLMKKSTLVCMGIIMIALCSACSKKHKTAVDFMNESIEDARAGRYVYKESITKEIQVEGMLYDSFLSEDGNLCYIISKDGEHAVKIFDSELNELNTVNMKKEDSTDACYNFGVDSDGYVYEIINDFSGIVLKKYDSDGKQIKTADITLDQKGVIRSSGYYCSSCFMEIRDNTIAIAYGNVICIYDKDLNYISGGPQEELENIHHVVCKNGYVFFLGYTKDHEEYILGRYDCQNDIITDTDILEKLDYRCEFINDSMQYDFVYTYANVMYGYSYENGYEKLVNGITSGINTSFIWNVQLDETHFADFISKDHGKYELFVFEKIESEGDMREIIKLGGNQIPMDIVDKIFEFNKNNSDYLILYEDYSHDILSEEEPEEMMKKDVLSGKGPDICYFPSYEEMKLYDNKKAFVDLSDYISKDNVRDNLIPSVNEAMVNSDGRIEYIPTSFYLESLIMKKDFYEETGENISFDSILTIEENIGNPVFSNRQTSKTQAFFALFNYSKEDFVDIENCTCDFESDKFYDLLEYAQNTYPDEINYEDLSEPVNYMNNEAAMHTLEMYSFDDYKSYDEECFNNDGILTGFSYDGSHSDSIIVLNSYFAIAKQCKNADIAYEFISHVLSDEYQINQYRAFPVTNTALDILADEAVNEEEYTSYSGKTIVPITVEKAEYVKDIIRNHSTVLNPVVYDIDMIIYEEVEPYFSGNKTAEECANVINKRVNILLNERK